MQIMGVTGEDADLRIIASGPLSHFSVCVEEWRRVPTTGEKKRTTTWFRCSAFGRIGEQAHKQLKKGTWVLAEGRMRCVKKNDKEYWGLTVDMFRDLTFRPKHETEPEDENQDIHQGE